MVAYERGGS